MVKRMILELEQLRAEGRRLQAISDQMNNEYAQLMGEKDKITQEYQKLQKEVNELREASNQLEKKISQLNQEREALNEQVRELEVKARCGFVPPGHYYSPIPSMEEVKRDEARIFSRTSPCISSIDLKEKDQEQLLNEFKRYYDEIPFNDYKTENLRYYFKNLAYSYGDALFLFCMIRHLKPKKIVEIGSGYSSSVILDTNELFFSNSIACTFIEPYVQTLESLLKEEDKYRVTLIPSRVQDVDLEFFSSLCSNDIIIVDSTHVSKINSDVNFILFNILPILSKGVYIHFHDVFYPFEYPKEWIYEGIAWNEGYLLRAFLQYNTTFSIVFWSDFLGTFYMDFLNKEMPLTLQNPGAQLWIKKLAD